MITIADREIGEGCPPYIIAEMSGNHNGDIGRACGLIRAAARAGVDAVKLQTYTADTLTIDHPGSDFLIGNNGLWHGRTLYELYQDAHTPWEWHAELMACAADEGITIFSSPFDPTAIDFLETLGVPAYKIASFEAVDLPLIRRAAATDKPLIVSTGMADFDEIDEACRAAEGAGEGGLALLHCISGYPTPAAEANLRTIPHLAQSFGHPVGLSDHTLGTAVSVAAVALGACIIEKHFTLARADGGPDAAFSLEPDELKRLVDDCRSAWDALGGISYERKPSEASNLVFRRSLYLVADIAAGETFTEHHVRSIRPGYGLAPKYIDDVLGRKAREAYPRGTPLDWSMIGD